MERLSRPIQTHCISMKHIEPDWNIKEFYNLDYDFSYWVDDPKIVNEYLWSGHSKQFMSIWKYHEPKPMPEAMDYIKSHFSEWSHVTAAVNYFKPGQYLPIHVDMYSKYMNYTGADVKDIMRCMVMLEDGYPGQILQIRDEFHTLWSAGDCFFWDSETPHAFYNMSMRDRYAVQVTGVRNET